ncbi:CoA pyrophosphatase [Deferribacter thermophilus]|uniref:NUDIX hydrolase n=1 Tax=Deferribacter thermophilus TaxID=53573 RepID=UPI003C1F353E
MRLSKKEIDCISEILKGYKREKKESTHRAAAVLIPIIYNKNDLEIVFTKRQPWLNNHSGEVSFPGGGADNTDNKLSETALREMFEETGVSKDYITILGKLDDEYSITNIKVTPYVGFIKDDLSRIRFVMDEYEVERIFTVPIKYFYKKDIFWTENWVRNGLKRKVYFYKYNDLIIWGLTGRILYKFLKMIKKCIV